LLIKKSRLAVSGPSITPRDKKKNGSQTLTEIGGEKKKDAAEENSPWISCKTASPGSVLKERSVRTESRKGEGSKNKKRQRRRFPSVKRKERYNSRDKNEP